METTTTAKESTDAKKTPRLRSSPYTSSTIKSCYELATKIDKEFTDLTYTPRKSISEHLGVSGGNFFQQLSSCVQYKLLDLLSNEGYKPTALFKKIKRPLPEENPNDLFIECFKNAPLNKILIRDFANKPLPTETGLANILERKYSIVGAASDTAAKVFMKNVKDLGLLGEGNIFNIDGNIAITEELDDVLESEVIEVVQKIPENGTNLGTSKNIVISSQKQEIKWKEIPVFLKGSNREAKVLLPMDFTDEDIMKVSKVLAAYLP